MAHKLHVDITVRPLGLLEKHVELRHEPTGATVGGSCLNREVEELKDELLKELDGIIGPSKNWLH